MAIQEAHLSRIESAPPTVRYLVLLGLAELKLTTEANDINYPATPIVLIAFPGETGSAEVREINSRWKPRSKQADFVLPSGAPPPKSSFPLRFACFSFPQIASCWPPVRTSAVVLLLCHAGVGVVLRGTYAPCRAGGERAGELRNPCKGSEN